MNWDQKQTGDDEAENQSVHTETAVPGGWFGLSNDRCLPDHHFVLSISELTQMFGSFFTLTQLDSRISYFFGLCSFYVRSTGPSCYPYDVTYIRARRTTTFLPKISYLFWPYCVASCVSKLNESRIIWLDPRCIQTVCCAPTKQQKFQQTMHIVAILYFYFYTTPVVGDERNLLADKRLQPESRIC